MNFNIKSHTGWNVCMWSRIWAFELTPKIYWKDNEQNGQMLNVELFNGNLLAII